MCALIKLCEWGYIWWSWLLTMNAQHNDHTICNVFVHDIIWAIWTSCKNASHTSSMYLLTFSVFTSCSTELCSLTYHTYHVFHWLLLTLVCMMFCLRVLCFVMYTCRAMLAIYAYFLQYTIDLSMVDVNIYGLSSHK